MKSVDWSLETPESIIQILDGETRLDINNSAHADVLLEALKTNKTITDLYIQFLGDFSKIGQVIITDTVESITFRALRSEDLFDFIDWKEFQPQKLIFENCQLSHKLSAIKDSNISELIIRDSSVNSNVIGSISQVLQLKTLVLENIFSFEFSVHDIYHAVHPPLTYLSLKHTDSHPDLERCADMMKILELSKLELGPCDIHDEQMFINVFADSSLSDLSFYGIQMTFLFDSIQRNLNQLKSLRLDSCDIRDENAKSIAKLIENGLENLDLSRNDLTEDGMKIIADAIISNPKFHSLDITRNPIGVNGMAHIQRMLEKSMIRTLVLDGTSFNLQSMNCLARGLEKNKSLYSLCLEGCSFSHKSIPVLFRALYNHGYLCGFYFTRMGNFEYIEYLGELLEKNKSLRQIGCPRITQNSRIELLLSKMEKNFNVTWIGVPDAQYYDDYHRYSDLNELKPLVPYTKRNLTVQTDRLREFILACRSLIILDIPYDMKYFIYQRLFIYAILPQDKFHMTTIMIDANYVGKIKSRVRFSPATFGELIQTLQLSQ
ncbi:hypothetical protein HDV06_003765 [Boothiomyces sp. JEL0866]|nr:hypothetical protein HDV06_003765 [Boothiomyces sp. JEL0866]